MIIKFRKKRKYKKMYKKMCTLQDRSEIPKFLKDHNRNHKICELGVSLGANFDTLLKSEPYLFVGVDLWRNDGIPSHNDAMYPDHILERQYNDAIQKYSNPAVCGKTRCLIIRDYTSNACKRFKDGFFNYIYIDADHTYEGISQDLINFWPKVKVGGIMAGHDYYNGWTAYCAEPVVFEVVKVVNEFRINHKIKYFHYLPGCNSWMIIKTQ